MKPRREFSDAETARRRERSRVWKAKNKALVSEYNAQYGRANREKINALTRKRYAADPSIPRTARKDWAMKNPEYLAASSAARRAAVRKRVPWYDVDLVQSVYKLSRIYRDAGVDCHVDHIVPLRSKLVCGLHVQNNLTVLLAEHNSSKGNRHWPGMPASVSAGSSC